MGTRRQVELYRDFLAWGYDMKSWSKGTRQRYLNRVKNADAWLLQNRGTSIFWASYKDLEAFLFSITGSAANRNSTRSALVGWGDFLVYKGLTDENPARSLPRLKESKGLPNPLDMAEARRILRAAKALGPEHDLIAMTLLYTALRRGNVYTLEWTQFSHDLGWVTITAKGNRKLQVPIHPALRDKLRIHKHKGLDPRWVFPSPMHTGRHMCKTTFVNRLKDIADLAGVENVYPHRCRHTAANRMLQKTRDIAAVKEYLGHKYLSSTEVYAKVQNPVTAESVLTLDFIEGRG